MKFGETTRARGVLRKEPWLTYANHFATWDRAHECVVDKEDFGSKSVLYLNDAEGQMLCEPLVIHRGRLRNVSAEDLESLFQELLSRPYGDHHAIIQHVYDHFKEHDAWPKSRAMRIKLDELGYGDLFQLEDEIGRSWITVGRDSDRWPLTSLTFRAVCLCEGAEEDIDAFLKALQAVVDAYKNSGGEPGDFDLDRVRELTGLSTKMTFRAFQFLTDRQLCSGSIADPKDGSRISLTLSDDVLQFSKVQTKEDYLAACGPIHSKAMVSREVTQRLRETMPDGGTLEGLEEFKEEEGQAEFAYDIALSFAGEDREYVEQVAEALRTSGVRVFYDRYEQAGLWGEDLVEPLDDVYRKKARYY